MQQPTTQTLTLATADDDGICQTQSPLAGGNLTLNGALVTSGVALLVAQRRVIVTSAGNDTSRTFTVYGTNGSGNAIREAVTGASGAAATTTLDFFTVTRVTVDAATAGAVIVGTSGVGSGQWIGLNSNIAPESVSLAAVVTGTVNYTVQYTYAADPFGFFSPITSQVTTWSHSVLVAKTATADSTLGNPCMAVRCTINSGTGTVVFSVLQAGIAGN